MAEKAATIFSSAGQIVSGIGANRAGQYNQRAMEATALDEERDGAAQELRIREAARAAIGQQVAAQGANGFQQGTGSAIDALAESQVNAVLDAMTVRRQAASAARSSRMKGEIAAAEGKQALIAGLFGAGSRIVSHQSDWATARAGTTARGSGSFGGQSNIVAGDTVVTPRRGNAWKGRF